ncbi:MAG: apolipoprotein N-acyltransferase [Planctomycetota bacterium]
MSSRLQQRGFRFFVASLGAFLLFASQPPLGLSPLIFVALVPWWYLFQHASESRPLRTIYITATIGYLASMQGLRHAHPLMILPATAMAAYLAIYPVLFFFSWNMWHRSRLRSRWVSTSSDCGSVDPWIAGVIWIGWEWVRNNALTGISVLMLGHSLADSPYLIQIADLAGTYAVSFVIVSVNAVVLAWMSFRFGSQPRPMQPWAASVIVALTLIATLSYGSYRFNQSTTPSDAHVLLVARNEHTEYQIDPVRQAEIYNAYERQTIREAAKHDQIDIVVWPESMMSGDLVWMTWDGSQTLSDELKAMQPDLSISMLRENVDSYQAAFETRSARLQKRLASDKQAGSDRSMSNVAAPSLIGGCSLLEVGSTTRTFSGMVHVAPSGSVVDVYAKTHLVMFGEYIPFAKAITFIGDFIPPGLGIDAGVSAGLFQTDKLTLLPNICIETAVERIAVNHLSDHLYGDLGELPDAIVTVTNDAWFNGTAVVDHHLRCAQLLSVATRRPVLSAANGGPTAWIDSRGVIQASLPHDGQSSILAKPQLDPRISTYVRFGGLPALIGVCVLIAVVILVSRVLATTRNATHQDAVQ